jgi:hypothetical protein
MYCVACRSGTGQRPLSKQFRITHLAEKECVSSGKSCNQVVYRSQETENLLQGVVPKRVVVN